MRGVRYKVEGKYGGRVHVGGGSTGTWFMLGQVPHISLNIFIYHSQVIATESKGLSK